MGVIESEVGGEKAGVVAQAFLPVGLERRARVQATGRNARATAD